MPCDGERYATPIMAAEAEKIKQQGKMGIKKGLF
jgi:hypothetical protein